MTSATLIRTTLSPVDPARDAPLLQTWLDDPHAAFWGMSGLDAAEVRDYLGALVVHPAQDAWIGHVDGYPAFYVETYDPARVLLDGIHDAESGDLGMHVLISPPTGGVRHGFTDAVFAAVMRWCFDALQAERVVVEPDVFNDAIRRKNLRAGFTELREVTVTEGGHSKTAVLSTCTRAAFAASEIAGLDARDAAPEQEIPA